MHHRLLIPSNNATPFAPRNTSSSTNTRNGVNDIKSTNNNNLDDNKHKKFTEKKSISRSKTKIFGSLCSLCLCLFLLTTYIVYPLLSNITNLSRPFWDTTSPEMQPWQRIYNYGWFNHPETECKTYGFTSKTTKQIKQQRIFDGFILSTELDLLHLRLTELDGLITKFILVEATRTFTNLKKPLWWRDYGRYQSRFAKFLPYIVHIIIPEEEIQHIFENKNQYFKTNIGGGGKWRVEALHRRSIMKGFYVANVKDGDVLLASDIDEIPRRNTLQVLSHCTNYPSQIVFELKTYIGGFHIHSTLPPKRNSAARIYNSSDLVTDWVAHHSRHPKAVLFSDAGWHCSWCFHYLDHFTFKFHSYSHNDRGSVDTTTLKQRLCHGEEINGMLPESYTFSNLLWRLAQLHDISVRKIHSTGTLPLLIQKNPRLYPFLLNGCDVDRHENDDPFYQEWKMNGRKNWKNKKLNVVDGGVVGEPICMIENVKNVKTLLDGICVKVKDV